MIRFLAMLAFSILLLGCAARGQPINENELNQIVVNQTNYCELVEMFGEPVYQGYNQNGLLSANWMYIKTGFAGIGMEQQVLGVKFNEDKTVNQYSHSQSSP